jgi:hypothetical protein
MTRHTTCNRRHKKKRGGAATALPSCYFDPSKDPSAASSGYDLLGAADRGIRPAFQVPKGGRRRTYKKKGGFYPSVMGNFTASASKYIVPMSLYALYKMMRVNKTGSKTGSKTSSKKGRRTRRR